jgi:hypothetical protein
MKPRQNCGLDEDGDNDNDLTISFTSSNFPSRQVGVEKLQLVNNSEVNF